jgi:hypothetical protein
MTRTYVRSPLRHHVQSATNVLRRPSRAKPDALLGASSRSGVTQFDRHAPSDVSAGQFWGGKGAKQVAEHINGERKRKLGAAWRR